MRPRIAQFLLAGTALIAGLAAGANAIANIGAAQSADLALEFWPAHPVALAAKAEAHTHQPEQAARLAREAIRATALSSDAFQALGLAAVAANPNGDKARPFLEYASRLSRRGTATQIWLLQQELLSGDVRSALTRLDGTMRVSEQSRSVLYPLLASAIAIDGLVAPAVEIFAREPVWLVGFLQYAIRNGSSLPNLGRIIIALPQASVARSPETQAALLRAIVAQGLYSEGRDFLDAVAPSAESGLVRDPSFGSRGRYIPFDWGYTDQVGLRASPSGGVRGGLLYSAGTGQGGRVAYQLIALKPGMYRLTVSGKPASPNADGGALWRIRCASGSTSELVQLPLSYRQDAYVRETFTVPVSNCEAQWLELILQASFSPGGVQGEVKMVQIEPVTAG